MSNLGVCIEVSFEDAPISILFGRFPVPFLSGYDLLLRIFSFHYQTEYGDSEYEFLQALYSVEGEGLGEPG